jgi:hypothetical protein
VAWSASLSVLKILVALATVNSGSFSVRAMSACRVIRYASTSGSQLTGLSALILRRIDRESSPASGVKIS